MRPILLAALLLALLPTAAAASPVATDEGSYAALGRVFPDPLGGCRQTGVQPCSPNAQGNVPALQFIGVDEFTDGVAFLNSKPEWQRYLEVWPLDGRRGANEDGTAAGTNELAYRLKRRARVTVRVLRGGKVVRSFKARTTRGGRTVRLRHPARKARRGDHKVRITVVRGSRRTVATLTSRRL